MSNEDHVLELAKYFQGLKYPEEIEFALNELIDAIKDGETVRMSCTLAKNVAKEDV